MWGLGFDQLASSPRDRSVSPEERLFLSPRRRGASAGVPVACPLAKTRAPSDPPLPLKGPKCSVTSFALGPKWAAERRPKGAAQARLTAAKLRKRNETQVRNRADTRNPSGWLHADDGTARLLRTAT